MQKWIDLESWKKKLVNVPGRVQICMHFCKIKPSEDQECCLSLAYNLIFPQIFFENSKAKDINDEIWK